MSVEKRKLKWYRITSKFLGNSEVAKNLSDGKKEESQQLEEYREKTNCEGTSSGSPRRHHGYCRENKALSVWATSPQWKWPVWQRIDSV
ncbi:hypothetical protein PoB_000459400 [Plakobranchus ocellatus]|uniref:Uncharacterized protein n=1 Tax=Plakobranchus ocellatus TaxID=259542 RepID=A0AAV3Y557_9GAST|nr:hypothetical protein PoB_000459400 [Plakobranchus ocellatus]